MRMINKSDIYIYISYKKIYKEGAVKGKGIFCIKREGPVLMRCDCTQSEYSTDNQIWPGPLYIWRQLTHSYFSSLLNINNTKTDILLFIIVSFVSLYYIYYTVQQNK